MILLDTGPTARGWHRLEAVLRCPQLYAWGYGQGGENPGHDRFGDSPALVRGSIGHAGLAHAYARMRWTQEGEPWGACPYYMPLEAMRLVAEKHGDVGAEMLPIAEAAVRAYARHYVREPFKVIGVEEAVETKFGPYPYTARLDLVTEDRGGQVWITDHKFVSRIEGKVFRRYCLSGQFLGLQWIGMRQWGKRFGGVRLNLVGCNVIAFARASPMPAPWMLQRFPTVVVHAEELIARVKALAAAGKEIPAAPSEHTCMTSYGECPAFELCRWGENWLTKEDDQESA